MRKQKHLRKKGPGERKKKYGFDPSGRNALLKDGWCLCGFGAFTCMQNIVAW